MSEPRELPIVVLISGSGTTLRNLIQHAERGQLAINIRLVVSSNPDAGGLQFAHDANIPTRIVPRERRQTAEEYRAAIFGPCREAGAELVVMGGFLKHVLIPPDFAGRVMNIHPSLIPAFCGQGFYGSRVHQAVIDYGVRITGCTVHFVDDQYDHGPIIVQKTVMVYDNETPESLAARVFEQECVALPEAIRLFAAGKLRIEGRRVLRS
jgi:phosphoribosylglycinamide formyltransferase-1